METKLPYDQISDMLAAARAKVPPGTKWQHYRGNEYVVAGAVVLEATNEISILYNSATHPDVSFVRPVSSWLEKIEWNGQTLPRFTEIY
jgi:hypothetical protein